MAIKKWATPTVLLVLLIMVVAAVAGCGGTATTTTAGGETTTTAASGGETTTTEAPAAGGTFTIAIQPQYKSFDRARAGEIDGMMVNFATYDTLVRAENGQIKPWVAESWTTEADNKTYIFKLRDDVTFNSGAKLTAEDVVFSVLRLKNVKGSPPSIPTPLSR